MPAARSTLRLLLVAAGTLVGLELLSRAAYTVLRVDAAVADEPWLVPSAERGWVCRPWFAGDVGGVPRTFDGQGLVAADSAQMADATRPKVVFLGDSNTFGIGVATDRTFVEVVDRLLPEVDAINLGVNGYSSRQGLATLRAIGPRFRPAVVVAAFSFNDRRIVLDPDDRDGDARFRREHALATGTAARANAAMAQLYVYRGLRSLVTSRRDAGPRAIRLDQASVRVPLPDYADNLAGIVAEASALGARVVFVALGDHPVETCYLRRGIALLEAGKAPEAQAALRIAVERGGIHTHLARIWLARTLPGPGAEAERARLLTVQLEPLPQMGGYPLHLDTDYQGAMRRVARDAGVEVVEAWRALDPADYSDTWGHFGAAGHGKVARLLVPAIQRALER